MHELTGKMVVVHPGMNYDPLGQQGKIGLITNIIDENDTAFVRFSLHQFGVYSADALLALRPQQELLANLRSGIDSMKKSDILEMLNIYLLQASGRSEDIRDAITLALLNETLSDLALVPVKDWIGQGLENNKFQSLNPGR